METCSSSSGTHCSMATVIAWRRQAAFLARSRNLIRISLGALWADRSGKTAPSSLRPTRVAAFGREYPLHLCLSQLLQSVPARPSPLLISRLKPPSPAFYRQHFPYSNARAVPRLSRANQALPLVMELTTARLRIIQGHTLVSLPIWRPVKRTLFLLSAW